MLYPLLYALVLQTPLTQLEADPSKRARDAQAGQTELRELAKEDWAAIESAYLAARQTIRTTEQGFLGCNVQQGYQTRFDPRGFLVEPQNADWSFGLALESYGWAAARQTVAEPLAMEPNSNELHYQRDAVLSEWFINGPTGLEHGFTLLSRPTDAEAPLTLDFEIRGGLVPEVQPGGRDVAFRLPDHPAGSLDIAPGSAVGPTAIRYAGLLAFDAAGRPLAAHFEASHCGLRLYVEDATATYPVTIDPLIQQAYLKASNTGGGDEFGGAVAISGNTVAVAARFEASNATGVNGDQTNNGAGGAGAVYVFVRNNGVWTQQAYLKASNTQGNDVFGQALALSGDTLVVSALNESSNATGINGNQANNSSIGAGAVYVFMRSNGVWSQQAYIKASNTGANDNFGLSVALSGDTLVVGAPSEDSSSPGVNGNQNNESGSNSGAAYVFVRTAGVWSQQAYLKASNPGGIVAGDNFGHAVAISGNTVLVSAWGEDSNATGVNGNQADNTAVDSGAVYVFERSGSTWAQQAYLKASNTGNDDYFGWWVAISGETALVGAYGEDSNATGINGNQSNNLASGAGAAYVFVRNSGAWSQEAYLKASNAEIGDNFGRAVALSGDIAIVAAREEDSNATGPDGNQANNVAFGSGASYVFRRSAGNWTQLAYLKASNTNSSDIFGSAVAISGELTLCGAIREGSNATGIDGNQADNSQFSAGAAYVYDLDLSLGIQSYGSGTPGCAGAHALAVTHAPMINSPAFGITCSNAPPLSSGLGFLATQPDFLGSDPFGFGVLLHLDPLSTALVSLPFSSDAAGQGFAPAPIPNQPNLIGKTLYAQVLWPWTSCSLPPFNLSTSPGLAITFLAP